MVAHPSRLDIRSVALPAPSGLRVLVSSTGDAHTGAVPFACRCGCPGCGGLVRHGGCAVGRQSRSRSLIDKGTPAYKRLILSHHKQLNRGDFLVDDRPGHNGADKFDGELIPFGSETLKDWPTVIKYLRGRS
jgi:hypothetical protein